MSADLWEQGIGLWIGARILRAVKRFCFVCHKIEDTMCVDNFSPQKLLVLGKTTESIVLENKCKIDLTPARVRSTRRSRRHDNVPNNRLRSRLTSNPRGMGATDLVFQEDATLNPVHYGTAAATRRAWGAENRNIATLEIAPGCLTTAPIQLQRVLLGLRPS